MFLYGADLPENPTFAPNRERQREEADALRDLEDARYKLDLYARNANQRRLAMIEAYDQRIGAIHEATGVQIENPTSKPENSVGPRGERIIRTEQEEEAEFRQALFDVAAAHPDKADIIGLDRSIEDDALRITREAQETYDAAAARAAGAGTLGRLGAEFRGSVGAMVRDPLQVTTLFAGGGVSQSSRLVAGRIAERVLTEAAINAGVEAAVQTSAQDWRRRAGLEHGLAPALREVGLAALFGGGFGGILQGGEEVFRAVGRVAPADALERVAAGEAQPGDLPAIADALGVQLDSETGRVAAIAADQAELDRAAFGAPPAGVAAVDAERLAADAIRLVEDPPDVLPSRDLQLRAEQVDRVVKEVFPIGRRPRKPQSLLEFLSANGGLRESAGELAARDLGRWRSRGYRKVVREGGRPLDQAREIAEEAGYIGNPMDYQTTTVDDLLRAIDDELAGKPVYSPVDQELIGQNATYDNAVRGRDAFKRLVQEVDSAIDALGIEHRLDDGVMIRAAELVDDETDAMTALERALDEDYRRFADAAPDRGESAYDDADIPFFAEDLGTVPGAGRADGSARADDGGPAGRGGSPQDRQQLPGAGVAEVEAESQLRAAGETPEPGTAEAAELSDLVLTEARGASETTAAGEQTLIPGVEPVTTKQRLETEAAKPMRGGDAPPPEGGLFDLESRQQIDIWDAMPAAREADGTVMFTTHGDMIADADRAELFSDLVASCKD